MPIPYKPLLSHTLRPKTSFYQYRQGLPETVTADSPALDVMTDLKRVKAVTVAPDIPINVALQKMIHAEVRLLLVTDSRDTVLGIISAGDIMGEKPVSFIAKTRIPHQEVLVEHIMTPAEDLQSLRMEKVVDARVGDLVLTLKEASRQHVLVVEEHPSSEGEIVRGIFSTTQIGRQLGVDIEPTGKAQSFAELEAALAEAQH